MATKSPRKEEPPSPFLSGMSLTMAGLTRESPVPPRKSEAWQDSSYLQVDAAEDPVDLEDLSGVELHVTVHKDKKGFGIVLDSQIAEGHFAVDTISSKKNAAGLQTGDFLLEVANMKLSGLTIQAVSEYLSKLKPGAYPATIKR